MSDAFKSTDLVSRLREARRQLDALGSTALDGKESLYLEAAEEIERLRNIIDVAQATLDLAASPDDVVPNDN